MKANRLRCEQMKNPMGIDVVRPCLSWICESGVRQSAYEIEVKSADEMIYHSGKVVSDAMSMILEKEPESKQRLSWHVRLWDENDNEGEWSEEATFEMGILQQEQFVAKWINPEQETQPDKMQPVSYLQKKFELSQDPKHARAYVSAHGLYEVKINGTRVGDFVLAPGTSSYDKQMPYQTYDVTNLLCVGENTITAEVADGWYRSYSGVDGDRNLFGTELAFFLQLENDGEVVCITDETWKASQEGQLRQADMQMGEVYDATMETIDAWHDVTVVEVDNTLLKATNSVPILEQEHFEGKLLTTPNGETVIDYGQNLAGYICFTVNAHAGDRIIMTHGETLDENGNFTAENFQDRKRHKGGGTEQKVTFICKEGVNTYHTKFSIWGFQYAKVETDVDLSDAHFESIAVYSEMEQIGTFTCGNDDVNQLVHNSIWSQKSNFCDVPTDCPTRERAAWTGDAGVFVDTGIFLEDCYSIFRKWLGECRLMQYDDGKLANIAPLNSKPSFFSGLLSGSTGWGDASIIVPYALYKRYDDVRILEENYDMMKKWYAFLEDRAKKKDIKKIFKKKSPYRDYTIETGIDYGEWCEPGVDSTSLMGKTPVDSATAYFAHSGRLLAEIAQILGKDDDAKYYGEVAQKATLAFRDAATEDGKITGERQAPYVRAIAFELLTEESKKQAVEDLNALVINNQYHLNTGFLSTPFLCQVLAENGHVDTAYRLLLQDTAPSWLYEVKKGANTIWETWEGIDENGVPHASLNHYSYGAICGWLFGGVCGIHLQNKTLCIHPYPAKDLGHAKAEYLSPVGKIVSAWEYEGEEIHYSFEIPANMTAEIVLEDGQRRTLAAGKHMMVSKIA